MDGDAAAAWDVPLSDGVYAVRFVHGTTTGKRIVYVNGQEVRRRDWMFKLVGTETFTLGSAHTRAAVHIEAVGGFSYQYSLDVDGRSLQRFLEDRAKTSRTWELQVDGLARRVVLEKDTMDVWCNGEKMDTKGEFVDDGTETHFAVGEHHLCIRSASGGKRKGGIVHQLMLDGRTVPAAMQ